MDNTGPADLAECRFLTRLPTELRLRIYEFILTFERPLKLRQIVAGSKNTSILRVNSKIHREALPVFYDVNSIIATRNDFCEDTDPDLQTPLKRDQVRHLLIRNFSQSIKCSSFSGGNNMYLAGCCDVCKPSATGFIKTLTNLPWLSSVTVDYHNHSREFGFIKDTIRGIGSTSVDSEHGYTITCTDIARYKLTSPGVPSNVSITFTDLPLNKVYNDLEALRPLIRGIEGIPNEREVLQTMREEIDRELLDNIYALYCFRDSKLASFYGKIFEIWDEVDVAKAEGRSHRAEMEALTEWIGIYCRQNPVARLSDARDRLSARF